MSASDPKPPSLTTQDLVADLKAVLAKSVSGNLELAARLRDLVRGIAADAPTAARDPEVRRELVARWLAFNVASLCTLTDSSLETMNAIVSAAETTLLGRPATSPSAPAVGADGIDIVIEGRRYERPGAPFLLENHYDRVLDVSFEVDPFTAEDHPPVPASVLTLDPQVLQLPAKGQAVVHAYVEIGQGFHVGVVYSTLIRISGFDAKSMRLSVRCTDDDPK